MNLPSEILLVVSDRIGSQRDRIRLLSVCRRWYQLFVGKVYACLQIEDDFDSFDGVARLDISLFQNPHLALAVREFDTGAWGMSGLGYKKDIEIAAFHLLLEQIGTSSNDLAAWKDQLDNNDDGIWLPILIIMMKNLRVLTMEGMKSGFLYHIMTLVATHQNPFDTDPALQHLEELWAHTVEVRNGYIERELIPFVHLPSMRVFKAYTLFEDEESSSIPSALRPAPASSGITILFFIDTHTRSNGSNRFANMIIACKNLRVFEYQHHCPSWADREFQFLSRPFYAPLSTQKHSLEVLRLNDGDLDLEYHDCHQGGVQELVGAEGRPSNDWFGSLHDFTTLRELRIRLRNLLDFGARSKTPAVSFVDILPRSLEYLSVADYMTTDFDILMANIKAMLACREDKFPALRNLEIQPNYCCYCPIGWGMRYEIVAHVQKSFTSVQETFEKAGIEFSCRLYVVTEPCPL